MKKYLILVLILLLAVTPLFVACDTELVDTEQEAKEEGQVSSAHNVMTASVDENGAIGIGWDAESVGTFISASLAKAGFSTMIPVELTVNQTTSSVPFNTGTIVPLGGEFIFNSAKTIKPALFGESSGGSFSLVNLSLASIDAVVTQASFEAQNETSEALIDAVRIGIFKREASGSGDYLLQGVLAKTEGNEAVGYGTIIEEAKPETIAKGQAHTSLDLGSLAARESALNGADQMDLVVLVWIDGVACEIDPQNADVSINLTFSAAS